MNDDGRGGVEEVHASRHVQRDSHASLPRDLHSVVLAVVVVVHRVVQQVEQVAVVAVLGHETHGIHHQAHEDHDVGVAERAHQHHLRVEVADRLRRHARHAQLLHRHFTAPTGHPRHARSPIQPVIHDGEAADADASIHLDVRPLDLDARQLEVAQRRLQRVHHLSLHVLVRLALVLLDLRLVVVLVLR